MDGNLRKKNVPKHPLDLAGAPFADVYNGGVFSLVVGLVDGRVAFL
jgi:hypothetical protein